MTRPLPDRAQAILHGLDGTGTPWADVLTVAMSAMNVGWTEQQFTEAVMASDLSAEIATENGRDRSDRLSARLRKAWRRAEDAWNPPISDRNDVRERLQQMAQRLEARKWTGRTASKDRAVALALVNWGLEIGAWTIDAGKRDLGLRAGVGKDTASRALQRLADQGIVTKDDPSAQSTHAQRWVLNMDWGTSDQTEPHDPAYRGERFMWLTTTTSHPAFLSGALGQTAERIWRYLGEQAHQATATEISDDTGIGVQTVRRTLTKLVANGVAEVTGTRQSKGRPSPVYALSEASPSLDSIAEAYGTLDWHERTAKRAEQERAGFAEVQRQQAERAKAGNTSLDEIADQLHQLMNPDAFGTPPPPPYWAYWESANDVFAPAG